MARRCCEIQQPAHLCRLVLASGCGTGKNKLVESFAYGILQIELSISINNRSNINLVLQHRVIRSQRCRTEIDGKPLAPDRNGPVLRQVQISAQGVVLVTDVSLYRSQIDRGGALHCRAVLCVVSCDQVHMDIRTVRSSKVREAENAISVPKAVDGCCTRGGVDYCIESAGLEDLCGGRVSACWKVFVHPLIEDHPLWAKRVPSGEQCDGEHPEGEFPFVHVHLSF